MIVLLTSTPPWTEFGEFTVPRGFFPDLGPCNGYGPTIRLDPIPAKGKSMPSKPSTVGELRAAQYPDFTVKEELERNVLQQLRSGQSLFPQIHGFEETVIPQLTNALLSHHDI